MFAVWQTCQHLYRFFNNTQNRDNEILKERNQCFVEFSGGYSGCHFYFAPIGPALQKFLEELS